MPTHQTHNRGAVLLIAVLMTSAVLSVGMGIYQRTYKSLIFSSYWTQTQIAIAAADAGIECAMYLDSHPDATKTCFEKDATSLDPGTLWTLGQAVVLTDIDLPEGAGCVDIQITKNPGSYPSTIIQARGHNTCDTNNSRRVERVLEMRY